MKKVLSCFVVLVILMTVLPIFVTQSNAVMPVDIYMGKVTEKNNDVLTVQIEYKPDYSNPHNWVSYSATSQWTISNSNAINEIRVGDYIEIAGFLGVDNEGESICIGKMKSSTEKVITDVYGDPGYLVPVHAFIEHPGVLNPPLLGDYIITYENIPDCSKYPSGSFACNVEAKYSDVTISDGNEQLKSQRLYPGRCFKYEDKGRGYNIDIAFNSGEAPAYPDCTDQPCLGPQAFSDFTIHIKKIEEKKPDLIIQDISWNPSSPKEGDTVTFTVTVKNQGSGSAGYSYVYYYIGGSYVDYDYVPSLSAGSTSTQSFTWTEKYVPQMSARKTVSAAEWKVPKAFPIVEAWIVRACADATDLVDESNEDNNCREETVEIYEEKKPDLIIEDISWDPSKPKQGDTITFTVKIKNRGDGNAGTSTVKYYIDGSDVDSDTVPSLSVGSTSTQSFTWTANKCGDVQVKAIADAANAVDESNEGNNERTETVSVTCLNHPPIAYIDSITPNPAIFDSLNVEESETISFSGHGTDPDGDSIIAYNWRSEGGTQLSTSSSFSISSTWFGGWPHTIYFKVKDSHNAWSNEVSKDFLIIYPILTEIEFKGKVLDASKELKLAGCLVRITEILEQKGEDIEINVGDEVIAVGLTESERYDTDIL